MNHMKTRIVLAMLLLAATCAAAAAQNTPETRATLAGLEGVAMQVVPVPVDLADRGITTMVLAVEVERVLKEGGVPINYPVPPDTVAEGPYLSLEVVALLDPYVDQVVYSIRLEFVQAVVLDRDETHRVYSAPTWSVGGTGVYSDGWRQAIIDDVVAFTGQFVEAYNLANPPPEQ